MGDLISEKWFTPVELGELLNLSEATLAKWRSAGIGPRYLKLGRNVVYQEREVEAWIQVRVRGRKPKSQAPFNGPRGGLTGGSSAAIAGLEPQPAPGRRRHGPNRFDGPTGLRTKSEDR